MSYKLNYASDVDFFEKIIKNNKDEVINFFITRIKEIVSTLSKNKNQYFFEVKCGLHPQISQINIGRCDNGVYIFPFELTQIIDHLKNLNFFTQEDIESIKNIHTRTQHQYELVYEMFRKNIVLRWNEQEIRQEYKVLKDMINGNAFKYYLSDAIKDKTACNIEEIYIASDNTYNESSNFYQLIYYKDGIAHGVNIKDSLLINYNVEFRENLKVSMYKLLYSTIPKNYNPLKAVKRFFSYSIHTSNESLNNMSRKILTSQIGELYMYVSKLKTLEKILTNPENKQVNYNVFNNQLDSITWRLQGITLSIPDMDKIIDILYSIMDDNMPVKTKCDILHNAITLYMNFISKNVIKELIQDGLYPLPDYLIPVNKPF
jgi:hypothetical protein